MTFFDSVLVGLKVLTHWEFYVSGIEFFLIILIPKIVIGLMLQSENSVGSASGFVGLFILPIFWVLATFVFIVTLSPILLGLGGDALWMLPWEQMANNPTGFLWMFVKLYIAMIIISFVPFFGQMQSVQILIVGGFTLVLSLRVLSFDVSGWLIDRLDLIPDFWFVIGIIVIGAFLSSISLAITAAVAMLVSSMSRGLSELLVFPISAAFGFIPVFIYGAWLGAQL